MNKLRKLFSISIIAILFLHFSSGYSQFCQSKGNIEVHEKFVVHKALHFIESDTSLTLDLFVPKNNIEPVPCIIVIQGGGFRPQNGQRFRNFAEFIVDKGYAAALISYHGRPDHQYLTTMAEVKASVRYVRSVSKQYMINPEKIGAMGRSAGGTLTALLAVTGDDPKFEGDKGNLGYSSKIQASVAFAGVFNFVVRYTDDEHKKLQPGWEEKMPLNEQWIGEPFAEDNKQWLNASAINHVDENDPPMLFLHCKDDKTVPWLQSQQMYDEMKNKGTNAEIIIYETGGHGVNPDTPVSSKQEMINFFNKIFEE